ncbi:MAG: response regulator [Deltaproteobacteria bacterium]|nr:response regulator [Deltaproteobacteria bacterium]
MSGPIPHQNLTNLSPTEFRARVGDAACVRVPGPWPVAHVLVTLLTAGLGWVASRVWVLDLAGVEASAALGVGLGASFCLGARIIPAAAVGVALAGLGLGAPPLSALGFGAVSVPALWVGERMLRAHRGPDRFLADEAGVWRFLVGATFLMPLVAAAGGAALTYLQHGPASALHTFHEVFVPVSVSGALLSPWSRLLARQTSRPPLGGVLAALGLVGVVAAVFFATPGSLLSRLWFATLLPFVWLSYRHGLVGGLFASLVLAVAGGLGVQRGLGPFGGLGVDMGMLLVAAAGIFACVSALVVVSLRRQHSVALARHAEASRQLTAAYRLARFGTWEHELRRDRCWWSDESFRILGLDPDEHEASQGLYLSILHPDDRQGAIEAARATVLHGAPYDLEVRVLDEAGRVRWVHLVGEVLDDSDAEPSLFVGAVQDVTRRHEDLDRAVSSQKMDALGTLAAGIAHDFNNILLAIRTHSELLGQSLVEHRETHDSIRQILSSTDRASRLVQQILTFGRGEEPPDRGIIDLRQSVRASVDFLRATLPATVKLRARLADHALPARAESTQLERVIVNLITNAYQAGGDQVSIDLLAESTDLGVERALACGLPPGHYARLRVTDNGPGVSPEVLERIFEPFFTTKPVGEGTGLGLSVVHGIVEAHGGSVRVESTLGEGTSFDIYLPLSSLEQPEHAPVRVASSARGSERVLLVDDEVAVTRGTRRLLRRLGYTVEVCNDGASALALFLDDPDAFDVVVTDHSMPGLTGTELTRALRKVRPELPVILTTGFDARTTLEGEEALFSSVLIKPFGGQELGASIRSAVDLALAASTGDRPTRSSGTIRRVRGG